MDPSNEDTYLELGLKAAKRKGQSLLRGLKRCFAYPAQEGTAQMRTPCSVKWHDVLEQNKQFNEHCLLIQHYETELRSTGFHVPNTDHVFRKDYLHEIVKEYLSRLFLGEADNDACWSGGEEDIELGARLFEHIALSRSANGVLMETFLVAKFEDKLNKAVQMLNSFAENGIVMMSLDNHKISVSPEDIVN
jgi:hypothetical protein